MKLFDDTEQRLPSQAIAVHAYEYDSEHLDMIRHWIQKNRNPIGE